MIVRCAVVGNPISHSLSPLIHEQFAAQAGIALSYEKIEGDDLLVEEQIVRFFKQGGRGLNITLPFKLRACDMASIKTPRCQQAKAANTLWMKNNQLHADNTDGIGLIKDLERYLDLTNKTVLIVGAGGAARGIIAPLLTAKAKLTVVNRTFAKAKDLAEAFPSLNYLPFESLGDPFDVIINATSASLADNQLQLPASLIQRQPFCYDLAYRRDGPTPFVASALKQGCLAVDGLGMLVEQAAEAFFIWHGFRPETESVLARLRHSRQA